MNNSFDKHDSADKGLNVGDRTPKRQQVKDYFNLNYLLGRVAGAVAGIGNGVVEVTTKVGCSLNCRFCPQKLFVERYLQKRPWEDTLPDHRAMLMSLDDFKTCVDKLPPDKVIDFGGFGEPQQNPAFVDMVLYAHSRGHPLMLYSTLVGMTRESYERIRDIPFKMVQLHIPDSDGNSRFTLSEDYLELVHLVIRDAIEGRFRINSYSCHGEVHPAIADIVRESGLFIVSEMHDRAGVVKDADVVHSSYKKGRIWCVHDGGREILLPDGTVVVCCMDFGMRYALGNLLTQSYEEIMQGEAMRDLRLRMKSEKYGDCICRHCMVAERGVEHFAKLAAMRLVKLLFSR